MRGGLGAPLSVAAAAALLLVTGCSVGQRATTSGHSPPAPAAVSPPAPPSASPAGPPASSAPAASPTPAPDELTISGPGSGRVTAHAAATCVQAAGGFSAQLSFPWQGQPYVLSIELADYHGPDRYGAPSERVSLHTAANAPSPRLVAAVSGAVTVDSGAKSGSIDAAMSDTSRVQGTWTCAA